MSSKLPVPTMTVDRAPHSREPPRFSLNLIEDNWRQFSHQRVGALHALELRGGETNLGDQPRETLAFGRISVAIP